MRGQDSWKAEKSDRRKMRKLRGKSRIRKTDEKKCVVVKISLLLC